MYQNKEKKRKKRSSIRGARLRLLLLKKIYSSLFFFTYIMEHILIGGHTMIVRGTTPSFTFLLPEFDVSIDHGLVSFIREWRTSTGSTSWKRETSSPSGHCWRCWPTESTATTSKQCERRKQSWQIT